MLAYTRAGSWVPGEQAPWLEFFGKLWGYFALTLTVLVVTALRVLQSGDELLAGRVSPWRHGAASPAEMWERTRPWEGDPDAEASWQERVSRAWAWVLLAVTVAVTYPLWVLQRFSRFLLIVFVAGLLWLTWGVS